MIVVEVNLLPFGFKPSSNISLGKMKIVNDGTGDANLGNYNITLYSKGDKPRVIKRTKIENWPRKRKAAWRLIAAAFKALE